MAHYCHVCERHRANERFSGRGHARHICRDCQRLPAAELANLQALRDLSDFFYRQSRISERNVKRLHVLAGSDDPEIAAQANALLRVAAVAPHRRKRLKRIRAAEPELLTRLAEVGLPMEWSEAPWDEEIESEGEGEGEGTFETEAAFESDEPDGFGPWEEIPF